MKKETQQLQLYKDSDIRRVYFATGAGLVLGGIIGGVKGVVQALRRTKGKKKALEYFALEGAQKMGSHAAFASCAFAISEYLLLKAPEATSYLPRMLE
ncbi:hypothetical protein NEMIN01_0009 [Nematocida minor]|uniref:uncharacterized protein n=1 Tax=Nematocida minor TaxID=1912983 RepID=UPI00221EE1E3|nr:uncharacterized protein NEMIN01_0002 [Nematocida minor]XP_051331911.1 uncharacterized protein NEMIN01_0009 [Nematocida minor]KAI5188738.1 hypothetical protein NEMIN01_0002 [Nematocida minor]KAI5188745.1 hypothetical protein NEMIN01_0009 [Nematocida minor]